MKTHALAILTTLSLPFWSNAQSNTFPSSGNVGVGTTSPSYKLEVNGTLGVHDLLRIKGERLSLENEAATNSIYFRNGGTSSTRKLEITYGSSDLKLVLDNSGFLGLGTTSPQSLFHLQGTGAEFTLRADALHSSYSNAIVFDEGDGGKHFRIIYDGSNKANGSNGRLVFSNAGQNDLMTIERNGYVGIGTSDPTHPLSVNGTIQAKEVIVETGWSDFVFEETYRLRSLEEVESHIEEHGHLPDVPSAAIVESKGLSVGVAQKIMMQKIEELTLYVIEQDKKNSTLEKKVAELESKLSQQNARYNSE